MKRLAILIAAALLGLILPAASAAEIPEAAEPILGGVTREDLLDPAALLREVAGRMKSAAEEPLRQALKNAAAVLSCALFASLGETVSLGRGGSDAARLAGVLGITATAAAGIGSIIGSLGALVTDLRAYCAALLPTVASAAAASGMPASAAANSAVSSLFITAVLTASEKIVMPMISAMTAVAAASAAFDGALKGVFGMLSKIVKWLLIGLAAAFAASAGFTRVISSAADEAAVKAARTALSTLVPVVGRTVADASEAVAGSFAIVRNTAGAFGLLVAAALAYTPFVSAAANYLFYKLAASLSEIVAAPEITKLISDLGTAIGYAAAAAAVSVLAVFVAAAGFIGAVSG